MGAVLREQKRFEESEALLNESRTKFDPQHERVEIARTDLERAKLLKAQGRTEESKALIEKVRAVARELGNTLMEIECDRVSST